MGRLLKKLGRQSRRVKILIAGLLLMPVLGVASVEITSQSWFCNSCHIMNPYYASWKSGAHKDVACVKCHISPGVDNFLAAKFNGLGQVVDDVLHRTSTKPSASVSQLSCTRSGCHSIEKVRQTSVDNGTFKFRHDKHLDLEYAGIMLACGTCHSHIKGDEHFEVNKDVCINCHLVELEAPGMTVVSNGGQPVPRQMINLSIRRGHTTILAADSPRPPEPPPTASKSKVPPNTCTTCHNPPAGTLERNGAKVNHDQYLAYGAACESCHRNTTATPEPIADGRCLACHTFGIERVTTPEEMHKTHLAGQHKIECFSCHGTIHHGTTTQVASLEKFDCRACHQDQHAVQRSEYLQAPAHSAGPGPAMSPMFMAHVDCNGCHISQEPIQFKPDSGATVAIANAQSCDQCHKPGLGAQMIPLWQRTTRALYDRVAADLAAADTEPGLDKDLLESTRKLLQLVRVDGSWGVHNPRYTQQLLEQARDKLSEARGKPGGPQ